jgi:hypothetical protein
VAVATGQTAEPRARRLTREVETELLLRHRPELLWDSQADFRAMSAESILVNPGNVLEVDGHVVAGAAGEGGRALSLELLSNGIDGVDFHRRARLKEAFFPFASARRLQQRDELANRVYGRVEPREGRIYLQYWIWLYYNPKNLLGTGRHEGDWEMVQVALDAATHEPVAVTYSQHGRGERKDDPDEVEWRAQPCVPPCTEGCRHPRVYVAPFSHACYFEAGTHFYFLGTDNPDGSVAESLPALESFGDWSSWPGRWGQQVGPGGSPASPECQKKQWDPERFERSARRRPPRHERGLWRLGKRVYPETPTVFTAVREGDSVLVHWHVRRKLRLAWDWELRLRPTWLLITVHDADAAEPRPVVRRRTVRVGASSGETRIPLSDPAPGRLVVHATAFNALRQRSIRSPECRVATAAQPGTGEPRARDRWNGRVWRAFQRALLSDLTERGAGSIDDLEARRMHVLELPLDRLELVAVVESARRAGLVEPLGHERAADGSDVEEPEWSPTEDGRRRTLPFTRWLLRGAALVPSAVIIALTKDVVGPWLDDQDGKVIVPGLAITVSVALALGVFLYRRVGGASKREIASAWSRHAVELPALNRAQAWWTRRTTMFAALALFCLALFAGAVAAFEYPPTLVLVPAVVAYITGLVTLVWLYVALLVRLTGRVELVQEARAWREDAGVPPARRARDVVGNLTRRRER